MPEPKQNPDIKPLWDHNGRETRSVTRREFLRRYGLASSALTLSPFFLDRLATLCQAATIPTRVYKVKNGDCFQNTAKLWELVGGPSHYIGNKDVVVIKGNAQWPNQGYTHTGCIKGVIDRILAIPGFSGEVIICDNTTNGGSAGAWGFDATPDNREHNWPNHNWNSLAAEYQANGKPVSTKKLVQDDNWRDIAHLPSGIGFSPWDLTNGEGWTRQFFTQNGRKTYFSYPIFKSPLNPSRLIDMKNGVWENGSYSTVRKVKAIFMPTLNNHGYGGSEDYAGITSAIKSFFGATEIHLHDDAIWNGYYHIHSSSYTQQLATTAGEHVGRYINTMYKPNLFITAAMWSGWQSRTGGAEETKTVLACENPVTLDYVACRDVISPLAAWLDPDKNNNTRKQILGCASQGIGTVDPAKFEVITYDFNSPSASRVDIEKKIRDFKAGGSASEQDVKDTVRSYIEGN